MIIFSFIIPTYNRSTSLKDLLLSFEKLLGLDFSIEVIVVNDSSNDDTDRVVSDFRSSFSKCSFNYITQKNSGPAVARNLGASMSSGKWLVFIDDDCILPETYLQHLRLVENSPDKVGAICGYIKAFSNTLISKYIDWSGMMLSGNDSSNGKEYFVTANAIVRRDVFDVCNGFNIAFRNAAGEDVYLSQQVKRLGYKIDFNKDLFVWHRHRDTLHGLSQTTYGYGKGHFQLELLNDDFKSLNLAHFLYTETVRSIIKIYRSNTIKYSIPFFVLEIIRNIYWYKGYCHAKNQELKSAV